MLRRLRLLIGDEKGATAIEYGLIISLIVLAVVGGMSSVAGKTIDMWDYVTDEATATL